MKDHKHYELAYRAHLNTSFSPDKRAESACKGFDADIAALKEAGVREASVAKYEALWIKWMSAKGRCLSSMITGPANFPVARNEKANNAERRAGDACLDYYNKVIKAAEKAAYYDENPDARPIMDGDSDALERLKKKLESHKKAHETMLAVNKIVRKKPIDEAALVAVLGSEDKARRILEPDCYGDVGFATYALNNNRATISRLQGRIDKLEKRKDQGGKEINVGGVRVLQNSEDMRIQIFFDGKPAPEIISCLKSNAFKWAPSKGAWQRQLTNNAVYSFNNFVLPELKKMEA